MLSACAFYAVLAFAVPGLARAHASAYRGAMNLLFGSFGPVGIDFHPVSSSTPRQATAGAAPADTEIVFRGRRASQAAGTQISARLLAYLPAIELVSLTLATPLPWRRRICALAVGLLLIHLTIAAATLVMVLYFVSTGGGGEGVGSAALLPLSSFSRGCVVWMYEMVVLSPAFTFGMPVLAWACVTLRPRDVEALLDEGPASNREADTLPGKKDR